MGDFVKSSGNASKRTGSVAGRARGQRRLLKSLKKRQARRNHVYFLMAAQGNRCIGGGALGGAALKRGQRSGGMQTGLLLGRARDWRK